MQNQIAFTGFPTAGLQLLHDLALNNNREWFEPRKETYEKLILEPARAFVTALGERIKEISPGIDYDASSRTGGSILRLHRDVRFTKDKSPYNTNLRMLFWEGPLKRMENPGFFIVVGAENATIYAGQHQFTAPILQAYRRVVSSESAGEELEDLLGEIKARENYVVGEAFYKKVPQGFSSDHPQAELLKYNGLYACRQGISAKLIVKAGFVDTCFDACRELLPLHRWLVKLWESV